MVAIMCYGGYNVEDAILFNEGSLKRGMFRTTYYNMYETREESSKVGDSVVDSHFANIESENVTGLRPGYLWSRIGSIVRSEGFWSRLALTNPLPNISPPPFSPFGQGNWFISCLARKSPYLRG